MGKKGSWFGAVKRAFSPNPREKKPLSVSGNGKEKTKLGFGKSKDPGNATPTAAAPIPTTTPLIEEEILEKAEVEVEVEVEVEAVAEAEQAVGLTEECAALKIQTAFRGYLARRALRALKGVVRLQALVQGQTVKRQATTTLRCMQALVRVQSQIRARRIRMCEENEALQRYLHHKHENEVESRRASHQEDWDDSLQSKEEIEANTLSKKEAAVKRERSLAYAFSHQLWKNSPKSSHPMLMEIDPDNPHWGWSWLERWMAARPWEKETAEGCMYLRKPDPNIGEGVNISIHRGLGQASAGVFSGSARTAGPQSPFTLTCAANKIVPASPHSISTMEEDARSMQSLRSERPRYATRHSLAGTSIRDDESLASSPAIPNYMVPTKSAKAKVRSHSPPKQRFEITEKGSFTSAKKRLSFPLNSLKRDSIDPDYPLLNAHGQN
eukprot:Gb_20874 [translate_table: standard]